MIHALQTLQNFTKLSRTLKRLYKKCTETIHNLTHLYKTVQNSTKLYTTLAYLPKTMLTELLQKLHKKLDKLYTNCFLNKHKQNLQKSYKT